MRTHVVGLKVVDFVLPPKSERSVYRTTQLKCALLGVPIVTKDIYIYLIFESILASAYVVQVSKGSHYSVFGDGTAF